MLAARAHVNLHDQAHCRGADLPTWENAEAVVSIDTHTSSTVLNQAVMRMRGLVPDGLRYPQYTIFVVDSAETTEKIWEAALVANNEAKARFGEEAFLDQGYS